MTRTILGIVLTLAALYSCSGVERDSGRQTASSAAANDVNVAGVAHRLAAAGIAMKSAGSLNQPFFSVPANVFTADGDDLQLYEFKTASDAASAASRVSPNGTSIGGTSAAWIAPPHFFRRDRVIAVYLGSSAKVLSALQEFLGTQIAGAP